MAQPVYETVDGSTPENTPLAEEHGRRLPKMRAATTRSARG